jgi:uncharacterized protein YjbI with pentapeptide repeats
MKTKRTQSNSKPSAISHPPPDLTRSDVVKLLAAPRGMGKIHLCGARFDGLDLSRLDFSGINLRYASFRNCNLSECEFLESDCGRANFTAAMCASTYFYNTYLLGADFTEACLDHCDMTYANASEAVFTRATLDGPIIPGAHMSHAGFLNATITDVDFSDVELMSNVWRGAKLTRVSFLGARDPRGNELRPDLPSGVAWTPYVDRYEEAKAAGEKAKEPPQAEPPAPPAKVEPPGRVWCCLDDDCTERGYLITERDDRNVLIAFVPTKHDTRADLFTVAEKIAARPECLSERGTVGVANDLRMFCRLDSSMPTPAEYFHWRISDPEWGLLHSLACTPFCRFRLARMAESFALLKWGGEERAEYPYVGITIEDGKGGSLEVQRTAIEGSDFPL